ncbi:tripartite ATP-independent periplasmic transporter DctQ component [Brucella abortus bv. 9 str. C68]|nr:tripartite ATP-independent periplasmic transporter DctQ component [Brucella abortus bv. 9 str. C68]
MWQYYPARNRLRRREQRGGGMSVLLALSRAIDAANNFIGKSVSWLVLVAVLISAINAVTRKLFNVSSNAWLEAQWYLFSAVFLIAAGYTLLHSEHVKVDLLYSRYSRRTQLLVEIFGTIFFLLPFCIITIYLSWPVWLLIPIGFSLLALQGISELIKRIAILQGRIPDTVAIEDAEAQAL